MAAFAQFKADNGWDLLVTEYRHLDWRNLVHCTFREEWFLKWNGFADGDGLRPWCLGTELGWDTMVDLIKDLEGPEAGAWVRDFNDRGEAQAAASRAKPDACEHCAAKRIAALAASKCHTRRAAPSLFASGAVRYVVPHVPLHPAARAADLVPDHVKGTPCLRAWACETCNVQETPTYDISSDVQASLRGAADALCLRDDIIGTTPG